MDERRQEAQGVHAGAQPPLPGLTVHEFHSGPLPHPELLRQYEEVSPGIAADIVDMAKTALQAEVDADLIPIRAESRALVIASVAVSFFPWVAVIAAIIFVVAGFNVIGIVSGVLGVAAVGPQILQSLRRDQEVPTEAPQRAGRSSSKKSRKSKNKKKRR